MSMGYFIHKKGVLQDGLIDGLEFSAAVTLKELMDIAFSHGV